MAGMFDDIIEQEKAAAANAPPADTGPQPYQPTVPGKLPDAVTPGPAIGSSHSLLDAELPELDAEAQHGMDLVRAGGIMNKPALKAAGEALLQNNASYQARTKQLASQSTFAGNRQNIRYVGENVLSSFAKLLHSVHDTSDEALAGSGGPRNLAPFGQYVPFAHGMTEPEAAAAYPWWPGLNATAHNPGAFDAQNLFEHDIKSITAAVAAGAAKGVNTDASRATVESMIGDFKKATTREAKMEILDHALTGIANDFNLTPEEAHRIVGHHFRNFMAQTLDNRAGLVRDEDKKLLIDNQNDPDYVQSFNRHLNHGRPGLAEYLIMRDKQQKEKKAAAPPPPVSPVPPQTPPAAPVQPISAPGARPPAVGPDANGPRQPRPADPFRQPAPPMPAPPTTGIPGGGMFSPIDFTSLIQRTAAALRGSPTQP